MYNRVCRLGLPKSRVKVLNIQKNYLGLDTTTTLSKFVSMLSSHLAQLLINLILSICFLSAYIAVWSICNRYINNKIIRAIIIGIVTPFLSFGFIINLVSSIIYYRYTTNEPLEQPDTSSGALLGVTVMISFPVSILLGFFRAIFILLDKSIKDEIIQSMKNDIQKLLKNINSTKNQ